jgi:hypothetical protein
MYTIATYNNRDLITPGQTFLGMYMILVWGLVYQRRVYWPGTRTHNISA